MPSYEVHPLFPARTDDEEPPEVLFIQIHRWENNVPILVPRRFGAAELVEEQQIFDMYGGGKYEITARNAKNITAKRGVQFAGVSKPLFDVDTQPIPPASPQSAQQAYHAQLGASQQPPWWIPLVGSLAPVIMSWMATKAAQEQRSQESHQALMATMMSNSQNANMQMITLLTNMRSHEPNGAQFKEGMKFMEEIVAGKQEVIDEQKQSEGEVEALMKGIGQVTELMNLASDLKPPGGAGT